MLAALLNAPDDRFDERLPVRERYWQWARPQVEGIGPSARGGHTATLVGSLIVVFGGHRYDGIDSGFSYFNDVHILDVDSNSWLQVCVVGVGDLHALDASTLTWYQGPNSGGAPGARQGHTCVLVGDNMVVHGGLCIKDPGSIGRSASGGDALNQCYLNDVGVLSIPHLVWSRLRTTGTPPSGRHRQGGMSDRAAPEGHQTGDGLMSLRTADMAWIQCGYVGVPPSNRYGHSVCVIGPHLVIVGGWDGGKPLTEVLVLRDRTSEVEQGLGPSTGAMPGHTSHTGTSAHVPTSQMQSQSQTSHPHNQTSITSDSAARPVGGPSATEAGPSSVLSDNPAAAGEGEGEQPAGMRVEVKPREQEQETPPPAEDGEGEGTSAEAPPADPDDTGDAAAAAATGPAEGDGDGEGGALPLETGDLEGVGPAEGAHPREDGEETAGAPAEEETDGDGLKTEILPTTDVVDVSGAGEEEEDGKVEGEGNAPVEAGELVDGGEEAKEGAGGMEETNYDPVATH
uniref:Uncharacterized protein n=1 Tax=Chromera velia CCMP2878 TaxID=1169474 RepID=A0A0G4F3L3_9ALVE|eukprot:Cvel_15063.t1-p1 / transcript=Cvel_15063.t1 / gene=Cvel_15063 / organism=Chromera_velia_CCMP2878 / gene_product=Rab9 effector protein with kelch motifs, putative / transcript_product=Rab9 effector protein with kelch motifs, putative / location=Cvel_scaffold1097:49881-56116(-) / protein_length=511 / sequence_SO=supercontig / SO=protein_coding / is_pseudo=false